MRIALAQLVATTDPAANLDQVRSTAAEARHEGAELIVFPEAMSCSFARPRIEAAEPFDGPWAGAVRELAAELGVVIVVGLFTTTGGPKVRNTLLVTGPGLEARYDKLHLFDAYGYAESDQIEAGEAVVTVPIGPATLGLTTCYDVRFPALYQELARAGADVILVPSSWAPGPGKVHQWRTLVTARALDATSWVVAVGQAEPDDPGTGRKPTGVGHSMVVDPWGDVVVELGPEPEVRLVDIDPAEVARARERLPVLANARFASRLEPRG